MTYPGGKGGAGVYQAIINQFPPHETYIEPFLGGGSVMQHKRPARVSIGVDLDPACRSAMPDHGIFVPGDALAFLARYFPWTGRELVYCDPPYLDEVRTRRGRIYQHEMADADRHRQLLAMLQRLPCMVAVSGYWSELYAHQLAAWRMIRYTAQTRGGPREECLWMNYPAPAALHDYRYLGADFRERERIGRKARRWAARVAQLPALERLAVLSRLVEAAAASPAPAIADSGTAGPGDARVAIAGSGEG